MLEIEGYAAPSEYDPPSYARVAKVTGAQNDPFHRRPGGLRRHRWPRHGRDFAAQARSRLQAPPPATQVAVRALGRRNG